MMSCETIYQCTLTKNRSKTPKEIREEFERLAKEREERAMQRRINPTSRLTMRVNATDLFERYMYDEIYDDVIPPSLPSLKISMPLHAHSASPSFSAAMSLTYLRLCSWSSLTETTSGTFIFRYAMFYSDLFVLCIPGSFSGSLLAVRGFSGLRMEA